ncbi:DUF2797 domain-containing protein [Streptomyces sp.]|uniref:DUF2797 domain-containing protein n=1 Tax=Streptomyces sp. TaxID=1931 RepID=UPI002F3FD944
MWRSAGLRWRGAGPSWTWWAPEHGSRASPLTVGGPVALAVEPGATRECAGVWRGGRWTPCPHTAELRPESRRDQCEGCAALDRSSSVAADTRVDDPRPYAVYLAYFGPGLHKVGITAVQRGSTRLLEQAAVCFTFLGEGPLMTARRTEAVLGAALRVPDRMPSHAKRAARFTLPGAGQRAAELRSLYGRVTALQDHLPDSLRLRPFQAVDHAALFGLAPQPPTTQPPTTRSTTPPPPTAQRTPPLPPPTAEVTALVPGGALTGTVRAVAGHDVYVETGGAHLLLDARLAAGWPLVRTDAPVSTVPTVPVRPAVEEPQPLF